MINVLRIKRATFYGYHGFFSEEQNLGGKFEADVDIYTDFQDASGHDNLKETVNYDRVYKYICKLALEKKYKLIETLAMNIANGLLLDFPRIDKVAVRVRKLNVPVGGYLDYVEAEVVKDREELQ
ncbi:MAG: dihydroneopterin aldolase [Ignavibacteria bacterium]|jgi:dihydroneopterin aldolase|nr:dihydroneopterin aldolase [Ignavibacteria bacterium]MCU7502450.1 dihydroneopterin aldolase [Ignavibacteria bacterium]MCU7514985.1 dihydroneopterin aldolase [Ignavibacteria bacterium]